MDVLCQPAAWAASGVRRNGEEGPRNGGAGRETQVKLPVTWSRASDKTYSVGGT